MTSIIDLTKFTKVKHQKDKGGTNESSTIHIYLLIWSMNSSSQASNNILIIMKLQQIGKLLGNLIN